MPGVTGPVAAAGAVLFFAELFMEVFPMSDFFVIANVTLPESLSFYFFLRLYPMHFACQRITSPGTSAKH